MLNRSASLTMSTSVFRALPGKLDIKRHSPSILYFCFAAHIVCWTFVPSFGNHLTDEERASCFTSCILVFMSASLFVCVNVSLPR